jgi:hypothetical protein
MKIIHNVRLCPLQRPNRMIINNSNDLVNKFNNKCVPVIDENENVIGRTLQDAYIDGDWICGSIELNSMSKINNEIKWDNARCTGNFIDKNRNE